MPKKWTGCTVFQLGDPAASGGTRIGSTEVVADLPNQKSVEQSVTKLDSERNNPFSDVWKNFLSTPEPISPLEPKVESPARDRVPRFKRVRNGDDLDGSLDGIDDQINREVEYRTKIALNPSLMEVELESFVAANTKPALLSPCLLYTSPSPRD